MLPNILGKTFYKGPKRPMPVNFEPPKPKDPTTGKRRAKSGSSASAESPRAVASPAAFAKEIKRAMSSTQIHLSPSPTTAVRVGLASFTPEQVAANVETVVNGMVGKFVTKGWRNVRSIHIKGPNTLALPIWLAEELWVEETDVLEDAEAKRRVELASQKGERKRNEVEKEKGSEFTQSERGEVEQSDERALYIKNMGPKKKRKADQREEREPEEGGTKKKRRRGRKPAIIPTVS